ncbi:hypothetical protein D3C75_546970 [compost metagenome]
MAFSDLFSADNLARLGANLNTGLGNLTSTPLGQFGVQMLANSGYRADNAGMGERLGLALQGVQGMQQQQALQQYRRDQIANEQARQHQIQQAAQQKLEQQQRYQAALQDPDFLSRLSPTARQFAALGIDPSELLRATSQDNTQQRFEASQALQQQRMDQSQAQFVARLAQGGGGASQHDRTPTPRQFIDMPMGGGLMQRQQLQPDGSYKNFGQPFQQFAPKSDPWADLAGDGADASAPPAAPAPTPPSPALPGTAPLQSYAPRPPAPMVMAGAMPQRQPNPNSVEALAQAPAPAANNAQQYPNAPAVGAIVKGHRYNGGNPASAASWSKI